MNKPLPLGVLLPTRNVISALPEHLKAVEAWLDLVEEIVVVDSCSNDGTVELIQKQLQHPKLQILSHPPGLYESWNYGIRRLHSKYTYVSTIGDPMSREGLLHLVETAEKFQSDVVLSRPRFTDSEGKPIANFQWPIHEIVDELGIREPVELRKEQALYYAIKFGAHSILGSSASNLYRTEVLQKNPFPIDFGGAGDTAWGILNAAKVRFAITPREFSSFILDPKYQAESNDGFPTKVFWLSCKVFTGLMKDPAITSEGELDLLRQKLCEAMVESGERLLHEGRPFDKLNHKLQLWAENLQAHLATERNRSKDLESRSKDLERLIERAESLLTEERNLSKELRTRTDQTELLLADERKHSKEWNPRVAQTEALLAQERELSKALNERIEQAEVVLANERNVSKELSRRITQLEVLLVEERNAAEELNRRALQDRTAHENAKTLLEEQQKGAEALKQRMVQTEALLEEGRNRAENLKCALEKSEKLLLEERSRAQRLKKQWWVRFGRHAKLINWKRFYA